MTKPHVQRSKTPGAAPKAPAKTLWWPPRHWCFYYGRLRCALGIHFLRGYRHFEGADGPMHIDPRGRPGPDDTRSCTFCGARWKGAYDGLSPFWMRVR